MGSQVSQEERSIVNIWTSLLAKQGIKYDRHQLKALLLSCKSQGIEANSENAFSVTTWEQVGLLILESDSQGDEIARSVMTTWQVVLDALRMLKKEWDMENQTPADGEGQSGKEGWVEEAGCTPPPSKPLPALQGANFAGGFLLACRFSPTPPRDSNRGGGAE